MDPPATDTQAVKQEQVPPVVPKQSLLEKSLSKLLHLWYAQDKRTERYLIILFVIGIILRVIAAVNLDVLADDMIKASQAAGIINAKVLSTSSHPALYYYLTDFAYKILGYTTLASRFWLVIYGAGLIFVVFLITKKLLNKPAALFAAFFVTFSAFLIRNTFAEESLMVLYFVFLGTYFGLEYLDTRKKIWVWLAGISFGLGSLTKYSMPFFFIAFVAFCVYSLLNKKEKIFTKENRNNLALLIALILLFSLPFLSFNYFIYKEKGIVDVYFSRIFSVSKAQELYQGLAGQDSSFFQNFFDLSKYHNYSLVYKTDLLLLIFGLAGLLLWIRKKEKIPLMFFLLYLLIPFLLQSPGSGLHKHFVFMHFLFAIPAGYSLYTLWAALPKRYLKAVLMIVLLAFLIYNLGNTAGTPKDFVTKSETSALKSLINEKVGPDDLILFDSRIYTARVFWLATDHHFLNFHNFAQVYEYQKNLSKAQTRVFVVECVIDDCGWGWISTNQEMNKSSEDILNALTSSAEKVASISSKEGPAKNEFFWKTSSEKYRVYQLMLDLNPDIVKQTDSINSFYFAPYLYKNMDSFIYNYSVQGLAKLVNQVSLWVIYLAMAIAAISIFFLFLLL